MRWRPFRWNSVESREDSLQMRRKWRMDFVVLEGQRQASEWERESSARSSREFYLSWLDCHRSFLADTWTNVMDDHRIDCYSREDTRVRTEEMERRVWARSGPVGSSFGENGRSARERWRPGNEVLRVRVREYSVGLNTQWWGEIESTITLFTLVVNLDQILSVVHRRWSIDRQLFLQIFEGTRRSVPITASSKSRITASREDRFFRRWKRRIDDGVIFVLFLEVTKRAWRQGRDTGRETRPRMGMSLFIENDPSN